LGFLNQLRHERSKLAKQLRAPCLQTGRRTKSKIAQGTSSNTEHRLTNTDLRFFRSENDIHFRKA